MKIYWMGSHLAQGNARCWFLLGDGVNEDKGILAGGGVVVEWQWSSGMGPRWRGEVNRRQLGGGTPGSDQHPGSSTAGAGIFFYAFAVLFQSLLSRPAIGALL